MEEEARTRAYEQKLVDRGERKKITFLDPICERYRRQEFYRRKHGVWFFNDGEPTYITGHHYMYLQWSKFDHRDNGGYPYFYQFSQWAYYFRQWCEENPKSMGYMIIGPRGTGKSGEELTCIMNNMTMAHDATAVLQSKSYDKDAKGVLFKTKLVTMFNAYPNFFKPVFNHGSNPETSFSFLRPAIKGTGASTIKYGPDLELNSFVFPVQPGEKVMDSDTAKEIFEDEIGKTSPAQVADIYERHKVNLRVVWRNHRKVGLLRKTSTVEMMSEGGKEALKLYKESDPRILDANGQTISKIHRWLISSLDTDTSPECCDKHGRVDRVKANQKIENALAMIKHDYIALSSEMRKNPRNEAEAFIPDQSKSLFNIQLLTNRLNKIRNEMPKRPYVRGNLYWIKEKFGPVWWQRDDHAGRWNWAWFPDEFSKIKEPDQAKILNNVERRWDFDLRGNSRMMIFPKNDHLFRIAADPIKYTKTKDPRASKQGAHGFRLYDHLVDIGKDKKDWETHNFIFEYLNRPDDPEISFEDMALSCIFLGCKMLPERNITNLNEYFERNGLQHLMAYPQAFISSGTDIQTNSPEAGYASTPEVIDSYVRRIIPFINNHLDRMPFDNTIEDWMNFDSSNPSPSHLTVSSGFALLHAEKIAERDEKPSQSISDWFDGFDNRGVNGTFEETTTEIEQ